MTKQEKVTDIMRILTQLYSDPPIPLNHKDAFTLLIAVLLSAQCTDARVNIITPLLFARADNPYDMRGLTVDEVREIIHPCGLSNTKSKAIVGLSEQLVVSYDGRVPDNFESLESLSGVGHKTAAVVMCQAFGVPAFPVDTHIHRLMYRWGLSNGKNVIQTEKDAKRLFPKMHWNKIHLQMVYYGRTYSPARGFDPQKSPIDKKYCRKSILTTLAKTNTSRLKSKTN